MNTNITNNPVKKKNYHKTETYLILAVLLAIAIMVPLWFLFLKPEPTPVQQPGESVTYSVYDNAKFDGTDDVVGELEMANIESIHFIKKDSSWGLVYDYVEENYFLDGYGKRIAYDQGMPLTFIFGFASQATAQRMVAEKVTDFSKYGLNPDSETLLTVHVKTRDGKSVRVLLGDMLADGSGYYATTPGNDKVYTINPMNYGYMSCSVYEIMDSRITNPFTESVYVPEYFAIYHGDDKFVELKYYGDEAADMEYIKTTVVTYPTAYFPYGASSQYSSMLYDNVRGAIYGEVVVDAEKEGESFSPDYLKEKYGIDVHDSNCKILRFYRDIDSITVENEVWFSPKSNDGYYFAYNPGLRTVVKIAASKVFFIDWTAEQYMEPAVYLQSINTVKNLTINSMNLQSIYEMAGHKKVNVSFATNTPTDEETPLKVTYNGDKALPDVKKADGSLERSGTDNYRYLFLALQSVDLYDKLTQEQLSEYKINLDSPDVTVTINTRKGEEHVLRFYYYGTGRAYFTYNGGGGYTVYQSALKNLLQSCQDVVNGVAIPMF
ncbi:MAG: DUF4340 domain-containing protein [Ruminococcaceae bacterium]|nr:DUF4340 domain-containing protein [Oscillospiraceae bacterium]